MLTLSIARLTILELWQSRSFRVLMLLSMATPLLAITISSLFLMDLGKVYMDTVAGVSQLIAISFLFFLVVNLLNRDIFDRVCYILLVPPVKRDNYFVGRFIGIATVFFLLLLLLLGSAIVGGMLYLEQKREIYQSGYEWYYLAQLIFFQYFQYISILGVIFFIVSWSSGQVETMLFVASLFIFTWVFPPVLKAMQDPEVADETPEFIMSLLQWLYNLMPHLQGSDITLSLAHGQAIGSMDTFFYVLEHSLYGIIFFVIGLLIFKRRDL